MTPALDLPGRLEPVEMPDHIVNMNEGAIPHDHPFLRPSTDWDAAHAVEVQMDARNRHPAHPHEMRARLDPAGMERPA